MLLNIIKKGGIFILTRTIELSFNNREDYFTLPINPASFTVSSSNLNQAINILDIGDINLIGKSGLISCSFSSFFPSSSSAHFNKADREPIEYINLIKKWKESGKPIRVIVTGGGDINLPMAIEQFDYTQNEGDNDIYYSINLLEYKFLSTPKLDVDVSIIDTTTTATISCDNGLNSRVSEKEIPRTHVVKEGEYLWSLAYRYYGQGVSFIGIYEANKNIINKNYYIYAGMELIIP